MENLLNSIILAKKTKNIHNYMEACCAEMPDEKIS